LKDNEDKLIREKNKLLDDIDSFKDLDDDYDELKKKNEKLNEVLQKYAMKILEMEM
jgi:hypothetical protein